MEEDEAARGEMLRKTWSVVGIGSVSHSNFFAVFFFALDSIQADCLFALV